MCEVSEPGRGPGQDQRCRWTVTSDVPADGPLADSFLLVPRSRNRGRSPGRQQHSGCDLSHGDGLPVQVAT